MFSFFQTIFHKVTTIIATAAIAIGFISAPESLEQPVLDNKNSITVEQQAIEIALQQPEVNIPTETGKLKKEIEVLRKEVSELKQKIEPSIKSVPVEIYYPAKQQELLTISAQEFINKTRLISTSTIANFVTNLNLKNSVNFTSKQKGIDLKDYGFAGYVYLDFVCSEYNQYVLVGDTPFKTCVLWATIDKEKAKLDENIILYY